MLRYAIEKFPKNERSSEPRTSFSDGKWQTQIKTPSNYGGMFLKTILRDDYDHYNVTIYKDQRKELDITIGDLVILELQGEEISEVQIAALLAWGGWR